MHTYTHLVPLLSQVHSLIPLGAISDLIHTCIQYVYRVKPHPQVQQYTPPSIHWLYTVKLLYNLRTSEKAHYIRVLTTSGCSLHQGAHYIRVFTTSGCSLHQGVHYIRVFTTSGCSLHQGVHYIRVFTTPGCSLH